MYLKKRQKYVKIFKVFCATMIEILEILAHSEQPLENDIIFLFNGG